ncbi:LOW QUALITY PROTEIN: hypothetical protein OSB04_017010 [Centaurea solstitialis]|uniref:Uncharacterized protein n=1 Tax=Centaurea solstitialis TaxID=347529 RepID=A0AA38WI03_9ASTR|nr:LOW QUALITY PROTEIN: hypothetical protein OSB04_017010 [Centaurea solstitialis]
MAPKSLKASIIRGSYGRVLKDVRIDIKGLLRNFFAKVLFTSTRENIYENLLLMIFRRCSCCMNKDTTYPACLIVYTGIGRVVPLHEVVNTIEAFFGVPGAINDIVVVNQSPIFNDLFEHKVPDSSFNVNNTHYKYKYYLADGIYSEWATFVKAFS